MILAEPVRLLLADHSARLRYALSALKLWKHDQQISAPAREWTNPGEHVHHNEIRLCPAKFDLIYPSSQDVYWIFFTIRKI